MQTELAATMKNADIKAQYDFHCKKVLGNKNVLARILKGTVVEFEGFDIEKIKECIEGEISISDISVQPEPRRKEILPEEISGLSQENAISGEGKIFFDIRFHAYTPNKKEKVKLIINVEGQKKFRPGYELVTRGIFYGSRMISSQLGTEFTLPDYDGIKKVYSIWVCLNTPDYIGNALAKYQIVKEDLVPGFPDVPQAYDKMTVIMVGINEKEEAKRDFQKMLSLCFRSDIKVDKKIEDLERKFHIPMDDGLEKEMNLMCNFSELVMEQGLEQGKIKEKKRMILEMLKSGLENRLIMQIADISEEELIQLKEEAQD